MATTIYDIARQVGTSYCTVSRALNGHPRIGAKTKERILKTAKEMSYRPSYFARGLTAGKTKLIGLVIPDFRNPFYTEFLRHVEIQCFARGYHVIPMEYRLDNQHQRVCLEKMLEFRCEGVIAFFQNSEFFKDLLEEFWEMRTPCIQTVGYAPGQHMDRVAIRVEQGVEKAVSYLAGLGHRKIVLVDSLVEMSGKSHKKETTDNNVQTSFASYVKSSVCKLDLKFDDDNIIFSHSINQLDDGAIIGKMLIKSKPDITAVIARNDLLAVGVLRSFLQEGLRVPEDISIIGVDNTWLAEISPVPLTSISINLSQLADSALNLMFSRIDTGNWDIGKEVRLDVDLLIRQSTGLCKT